MKIIIIMCYNIEINLRYEQKLQIIVYQTMKATICIFVTILSLALTQSPPVFPNQFEIAFSEKASLGPISGNTTGKIYYDYKNNRQLITRANGHYDRYCGSVFKLQNTRCNHLIVQNKRFLDFPDKKYCCFCCDGSHGCGVVLPDWIGKSNATYQGQQKLQDGKSYIKWEIKGLQSNLYYHADDSLKTPRRLYQVSDDLMDFSDYYVGIKDQSVFAVPSYCNEKCGLTTICAGLRGQMKVKTQ